jgi:hypothetical protein
LKLAVLYRGNPYHLQSFFEYPLYGPLFFLESTQKLNFPDSGISSAASGIGDTSTATSNTVATASNTNIGPQLQGIVSQLANDIDSTKDRIDALTKSNANTQKALQDLKGANDKLYMIGMGGVGAGVAGIVIAVATLSRRNVVEV